MACSAKNQKTTEHSRCSKIDWQQLAARSKMIFNLDFEIQF